MMVMGLKAVVTSSPANDTFGPITPIADFGSDGCFVRITAVG